jgi:hypothetical protein
MGLGLQEGGENLWRSALADFFIKLGESFFSSCGFLFCLCPRGISQKKHTVSLIIFYFYVNKPIGSYNKKSRRQDQATTPTRRGEDMMDELMPELVALVLNHVDLVSLVACPFVCTTWKRVSLPLLALEEDYSHSREVAANGWLGLLQWARANGCPWNKVACARAAKGGHLDVLQWACTNGCPWDERTCADAAKEGHLDVLQWARANGCPWNESTCANAAEGGHLAVLQWAWANGCPWDDWTCASAARGGHLEVLQWARANGCPWDRVTCASAARRGHLEVLQWARTNGCPWDEWTCAWAKANGCPSPP